MHSHSSRRAALSRPPRVLVIEDDADARANLRDILELDDLLVATAGSIREGLAVLARDSVDYVILDRRLPDGLAEQALPRIRQAAPDAGIIIVTAYADLDGVIAALREGADDYLLKPVNPELLRQRLGQLRDRQQLAEAQRRALQAERLAAVGQMVAGLAHESRNALQRSQACLEMLEIEIEGNAPAQDLVRRIQRAQDQLTKLFDELRGYVAPIQLDRGEHNLAEIWHEAWESLSPQRAGRTIALHEHLGGVDLHCRVDRFRLVQVFRNLLENALAAGRDPVQIDLICEPAVWQGADAIRVRVRDNGPGLSSEQRTRIFEPFFTTKTQGTGLGMPIAKRIMDAHSGDLCVGADWSSGAELIVVLPRNGP